MRGLSSWIEAGGWKTVAGTILVLVIIGVKVWNSTPRYHEFWRERVTVPVGQIYTTGFGTQKQAGKIRLEMEDVSGGDYRVVLLDASNTKKVEAMAEKGLLISIR